MKKTSTKKPDDYELKDEYDLAKMTVLPKGRFDPKRRIAKNVVVLDADVAEAFRGDDAVNKALRLLLKAAKVAQSK